MPEIAVCLRPELEPRFTTELERHGYRVVLRAEGAAQLEAALGTMTAQLVVADAGQVVLTAGLLAACDDAGVRIVAVASGEAERRNARDLGLHEVIDASAEWRDLEAVLTGGVRASGTVEPIRDPISDPAGVERMRPRDVSLARGRRGTVIAVWGPAGAPGRTTVAIAIAAELAAEGLSVVLADADTHSGSIAPALGLLDEAPGFAAACRLAATESLTTEELERVAERFRSPHGNFWVLTGLGRPHRWPELSAERVVATIAACRDWVDVTVLDTGFSLENDEEISSDLFAPRRNAATISALREADHIVAVGAGDPVGLSRFLRAHVDLLELVDAERVTTVVNKIRGSAIGLNPAAQVEQTLLRFGGITSPVLIPYDHQALDAAVLSGKTLRDVAAKSAPRLAISAFVASRLLPLAPRVAPETARSSRFEPVP